MFRDYSILDFKVILIRTQRSRGLISQCDDMKTGDLVRCQIVEQLVLGAGEGGPFVLILPF